MTDNFGKRLMIEEQNIAILGIGLMGASSTEKHIALCLKGLKAALANA